MPTITRNFTKYTVYYIAGGSPKVGVPQDAEIDCFNDAGQRMGAFYFYLPRASRSPPTRTR